MQVILNLQNNTAETDYLSVPIDTSSVFEYLSLDKVYYIEGTWGISQDSPLVYEDIDFSKFQAILDPVWEVLYKANPSTPDSLYDELSGEWVVDPKKEALNKLEKLYRDTKQACKNYIADKELFGTAYEVFMNTDLKEEYEQKAKAIHENDVSYFLTEASAKGVPIDEYLVFVKGLVDVAEMERKIIDVRTGNFRVIVKNIILGGGLKSANDLMDRVQNGLRIPTDEEGSFHPAVIISATDDEFINLF